MKPILSKDLIDEPDFLLIFDKTLVHESLKGLKKGSVVIFNSDKMDAASVKKARVKAYFVKATDIALNHIKKPVPNAAMLGALLKYFSKVSLKSMKAAMEQETGLLRENAAALEEGYRSVR